MTTRDETAAPRQLIVVLALVALTVALLQTAVVPVLGVIADQLGASPVAVSWAITANLLAAAAATPLIGRLADVYNKKHVLVVVLVIVLAGSLLAATTASLSLLITARVLQGVSFALYPVCVAILRDELPEGRVVRALAAMSATLGFGGGAGLVVTGLLMDGDAGYHRVFWLSTAFTIAVLLLAVTFVPSRPGVGDGTIDWPGAIGLAAGLSATLLAITQGNSWGWSSPAVLGTAAGGIAALGLWWLWERHRRHPLVSIDMVTRRAVMFTNVATVLVGMGLYCGFLGLTLFVQIDRAAAGYGFTATVLQASVFYLLPGALTGFVTASLSGRLIERFGPRRVLVIGAGTGVAGFGWLALSHDHTWQVIGAGLLVNAYISLGYGALPALVVAEVDSGETGVATSVNAIARTMGSSVAAAFVAVLLSRPLIATGLPPERSFVAIFAAGAVTAALAVVLIAISGGGRAASRSTEADIDSRAMNHEWG